MRGYSALLGLDICHRGGLELRLYDPVSGEWLLNHRESEAARLAAEAENQMLREQIRRLQEGR